MWSNKTFAARINSCQKKYVDLNVIELEKASPYCRYCDILRNEQIRRNVHRRRQNGFLRLINYFAQSIRRHKNALNIFLDQGSQTQTNERVTF